MIRLLNSIDNINNKFFPRIYLISKTDLHSEKKILESLNEMLKDKSAIIITHRIFTLLSFDNIIVLENGEIVEEGNHEMLLAKRGVYFELYEKQRQEQPA